MTTMPLSKNPAVKRIDIRITESDKERLKGRAKTAGMSISEFMRRRALSIPVIAYTDMVTVRELRRLGGLLKHLHKESKGRYSQDTSDTLITLQSAIRKLLHQAGKDDSQES